MLLRHAARLLLAGFWGFLSNFNATASTYLDENRTPAVEGSSIAFSPGDSVADDWKSGSGGAGADPREPAGANAKNNPELQAVELPALAARSRAVARHDAAPYDSRNDAGLRFFKPEAGAISTMGDPSRFVQTLPGVGRPNDWENTLIVRGSAPDQTIFTIDGIPLYRANHFEGLHREHGGSSLVNLEFADELAFHSGPLQARMPDVLSGAVEMRFRDGDTSHHQSRVGLDAASAGGRVEGPLPGSRGSYAVAGRYSALDLLVRSGAVKAYGMPRFWNGQVRLYLPAGSSAFRIHVLGGSETWLNSLADYASLDLEGHALSLDASWEKNSRGNLTKASLYVQDQEQRMELRVLRPVPWPGIEAPGRLELGSERRYGASLEQSVNLNRNLTLRAGGSETVLLRNCRLMYREPAFVPELRTVVVQNGDMNSQSQPMFEAAAYAEADLRLGAWEWYAGYRHFYEQLSDRHGAGPRLGARFHASRSFILKSAAGIHSQPHAYADFVRPAEGATVELPRMAQASAGWEWRPVPDFLISLEGFAKEGLNLTRPRMAARGLTSSQVFTDTGRTSGLGWEAFLSKPRNGRYSFSFAYGFLHHREKDAAGFWAPGANSVPHRFNAAGEIALLTGLFLGCRVTMASGAPFMPYDTAASARSGAGVYDLARAYRETGPAFSRLDLRLETENNIGGMKITAYGEIENVLDRRNTFEGVWNPLEARELRMVGMGRLPTAGLTVTF